jgi:hypothetical protein
MNKLSTVLVGLVVRNESSLPFIINFDNAYPCGILTMSIGNYRLARKKRG